MIRRTMQAFVFAAALAPLALGQWQLEAVLNGGNEVPPVPTAATGFAYFTLNQPANTITYHVSVSGVAGTGAHLHMAPAGMSNPAVFIGLGGGPTVWSGTTPALSAANVVTLLNEGIYVNVHSAAFPGGEIRGQLVPVRRTFLAGACDGAQETPPNASTATGFGTVRLNEPEGRVIYDLKQTGLVNVTAAHIHAGAPGVAGGVVIPLAGGPTHWCGISQALTPAEIATLKSNGMYFNIHTMAFPLGEIRGQILQSMQPFSVVLNGAQEVPPVATAVTGCGQVTFNPATSQLAYSIIFGVLPSGYVVSHIHRGVVGQAGAPIITLGPGPAMLSGVTAALTTTQIADLFKGNLYVNIHSNAFGGGEIRGQIRPDPYVFGFGGDGTSGKPRLNASGYNPPGSPNVTVSLTNAFPGAGVLVLISGNATFSTILGAPLPAAVPPIGTLWIDGDPSFAIPLGADALGCAEFTVPAPAIACFRGYLQAVSTDPINASNLVLSDAVELTLQ